MMSTNPPLAPRTLLEQGNPADDARAFRRCLGLYPTGVTVITASHGDQLAGMAVNSFAAVSLDPPLVLWSIRRESRSLEGFLGTTHFAVNILAADQVDTSQLFGAGHPERFTLTPWHAGAGGAPLLDQAIAHLECRRTAVVDGGDHLILLGQVERYARFDGEPLVFAQGQYAVSRSHPQVAAKSVAGAEAAAAPGGAGDPSSSFLKLLSQTQQRMSALFDEHRRELGVTQASTRVLTRLHESPCGIDALERATYLGRDALEDSLAELLASGCVLRRADGTYELSAQGLGKRDAVAARSAQFTREQLRGVQADDIPAAQRVLTALLHQ